MKRTQAIRQARDESHLSPIGGQYEVVTWSEDYRAWHHGQPCDYWQAALQLAMWRVCRATELLGGDGLGAECALERDWGHGVRWTGYVWEDEEC